MKELDKQSYSQLCLFFTDLYNPRGEKVFPLHTKSRAPDFDLCTVWSLRMDHTEDSINEREDPDDINRNLYIDISEFSKITTVLTLK